MARDFAEPFYKSKRWQKCRDSYLKRVGGLCELCLKKGYHEPATIVHHIIWLDTEERLNDPAIAYGEKNLLAVCRSCHAKIHELEQYLPNSEKMLRRYTILPDGRVITEKE